MPYLTTLLKMLFGSLKEQLEKDKAEILLEKLKLEEASYEEKVWFAKDKELIDRR